jgi:hypothetical protein
MSDTTPDNEKTPARIGVQVDTGLFSRVEQLVSSARLTQNERIAVETRDIASEVHIARKEFDMRHIEPSLRSVNRLSASFEQRVAQWESLARRKEQDKLKLSLDQIRKMHAEHSAVRTRVQLVRTQIRRLRSGLDQMNTLMQSPAGAAAGPTVPTQPAATPAPDARPGASGREGVA